MYSSVQPRKNLHWTIAFYSLLAFALSGFLLPFVYYVTSDGAGGYLPVAKNLFQGHGVSINPGEPYLLHPPLYSFLIGLANLVFRDLEFSGHFVSMLAFALTVIPLFLLAREIYSDQTAHWVSFLFVTHGFLLSHSNLIMTESLFTLFVFAQLYLVYGMMGADRLSGTSAMIWGLLGGMGYLTRPEGLLFYLMGFISFLFLCAKPWIMKIRLGLVSLTVFLIFFIPYVAFLSRASGHLEFGGQNRVVLIKRQLDFSQPGQYMEVKKIYEGLSKDKTRLKISELVDGFSLTHYLTADRFALIRVGLSSIPVRLLEFGNYFFGGMGFLFVGASFLSVPWDRRRKQSELLLMAFMLPFLSYLFLLFYPRRFVLLLPFFLIWMGNGMNIFTHWLRETFQLGKNRTRCAVLVIGLLLLLPSVWYVEHVLPKGDFPFDEKEFGLWMKKNIPFIENEKVASHAYSVNFYAGSQFLWLPYAEKFGDFLIYMDHQKAKYFVVSDDLEEPVKQSYLFLLDETQPLPHGISRRYTLQGKNKKMILYEISTPSFL